MGAPSDLGTGLARDWHTGTDLFGAPSDGHTRMVSFWLMRTTWITWDLWLRVTTLTLHNHGFTCVVLHTGKQNQTPSCSQQKGDRTKPLGHTFVNMVLESNLIRSLSLYNQ